MMLIELKVDHSLSDSLDIFPVGQSHLPKEAELSIHKGEEQVCRERQNQA